MTSKTSGTLSAATKGKAAAKNGQHSKPRPELVKALSAVDELNKSNAAAIAGPVELSDDEPPFRNWPEKARLAAVVAVINQQVPQLLKELQSKPKAAEQWYHVRTEAHLRSWRLTNHEHFEIMGFPGGVSVSVGNEQIDFHLWRDLSYAIRYPQAVGVVEPKPPAAAAVSKETKPTKRETRPAVGETKDVLDDKIVQIPLCEFVRHPKNRRPTPAEIAKIQPSFIEDGQLDTVKFRRLPDGTCQILSGETRWLAAKGVGWTVLKAQEHRNCSDARALQLLAIYNAKRTDLNVIQKAELIEELCKPAADGGGGMTRQAAGEIYGLESASAASNLVRLLELPKVWKDRVASGELQQSWAREVLRIIKFPEGMASLEGEWRTRDPDNEWNPFSSRIKFVELIDGLLDDNCIRFDEEISYYDNELPPAARGNYKCLIDLNETNRKALAILEIDLPDQDGKSRKVEVATNLKEFRRLQITAIKAKFEAKGKGKAAAAGKAAEKKGPPPKSKEEIKHEAASRAAQLANNVDDWKEQLMREELGAKLAAADVKKPNVMLLKLVLHYFVSGAGDRLAGEMDGLLESLTKPSPKRARSGFVEPYDTISDFVATQVQPLVQLQRIGRELCVAMIAGNPVEDVDRVDLSRETLARLFGEWGCDLTAAWQRLYKEKSPRLEEFFEHHRKDELLTLGKELDVFLQESESKSVMIRRLADRLSPTPLPKCLQDKPAKKGAK